MAASFASLPDDAWYTVFNRLPPEDRIRLGCVDRQRAAACASPGAWMRVTFTPEREYSDAAVTAIFKLCARSCVEISARGCNLPPPAVCRAVHAVSRQELRAHRCREDRGILQFESFKNLKTIDLSHQAFPETERDIPVLLDVPALAGITELRVSLDNVLVESDTSVANETPTLKPTHASLHLTDPDVTGQVTDFVRARPCLESLTLCIPEDEGLEDENLDDEFRAALLRLQEALESHVGLRALKFHFDCGDEGLVHGRYARLLPMVVPRHSGVTYLQLASRWRPYDVIPEDIASSLEFFGHTGDACSKRAFTPDKYPNLKSFVCQGTFFSHAVQQHQGWTFGDVRLLSQRVVAESSFELEHNGQTYVVRTKTSDAAATSLADCVDAGVSPRFFETLAKPFPLDAWEDFVDGQSGLDDSDDFVEGSDDGDASDESYSAVSSDDVRAEKDDIEDDSDEDEGVMAELQSELEAVDEVSDSSDSEPASE